MYHNMRQPQPCAEGVSPTCCAHQRCSKETKGRCRKQPQPCAEGVPQKCCANQQDSAEIICDDRSLPETTSALCRRYVADILCKSNIFSRNQGDNPHSSSACPSANSSVSLPLPASGLHSEV